MVDLQNKTNSVGRFFESKILSKIKPCKQKWDTEDSLAWKHMLMNRQHIEQHIHWKLQARNCSFWWDNWLGSGPLTHHTTNSNRFNNTVVAEFREEGKWSWSKLIEQAPANQFLIILVVEVSPNHHFPDKAVWNLNNHGNFSCS